jgi:hypothetical protein
MTSYMIVHMRKKYVLSPVIPAEPYLPILHVWHSYIPLSEGF